MNEITKQILEEVISEKKDYLKYVEENIQSIKVRLDSEKAIQNRIIAEVKNLEEDLKK